MNDKSKNDDIVSLERLEKAFKNVSFQIKCKKDATNFMKSRNLGKCSSNRFLAWMVSFDAIPEDPSVWPETFYHMIRNYRNKLNYYHTKSKSEIPNCLTNQQTEEILADVKRGKNLFRNIIKEIGVPLTMCDDSITRITRILVIMISDAPQHSFLQGFDRLASVSFALSLHFALRISLSLIEAEAFAAVLLRNLVTLSEPAKFLTLPSTSMQFFVDLDAFLFKHNRKLMKILFENQLRSEHFAANWVGVFFADSHTPLDVLYIWDNVIINRKELTVYIKALVSTHLDQIEIVDDPGQLIQNIMTFQDWDVERIVQDAKSFLHYPFWSLNLLSAPLGFWL
ncbi:hypothetical protein TVAG_346190 [Trichomonas vaginalis G3]|uniref:Rab-GAP TBC domain-containing protein n=1 Tax=Trichomonas vaginalis (strain ATCC PRA-98 / G3) TaxID=412133 RepID=A2FK09_TRIV3|nr:TBC domain-containing protein kinase-like protein family [Trichomonas vaginalis G3]EAX94756.1 hypothetical protein TVAG_346190 [Trichomonas vaginalis G3]KAI5491998.1 TBC domain-containing protein kinase-like protein family [Trichomonas vaginalis G3]|eukprot:XP_001307686.1 hypothetical protein [Trichomonas vaginalis G3]